MLVEGMLASNCAEHLAKDRRIVVAGRLEHRQPAGQTQPDLYLVATMLQVLGLPDVPPASQLAT